MYKIVGIGKLKPDLWFQHPCYALTKGNKFPIKRVEKSLISREKNAQFICT